MRISWNWLKTLGDLDHLTPHEAASVLTSTGLEVESVEAVEPVKGMLAGVIVGHVLACTKHPDADRLTVCSVDLGTGDPVNIVCGAPNVAAGQKVLVATVGTTLYPAGGDALTIKRSKIRGVESNGMICAEDELGLGTSHAGILVLDAAAPVGRAGAEQLNLTSDFALEIGLTPNRSDALGHLGVARDLLAALNVRNKTSLALRPPSVETFTKDDDARTVKVDVQAPQASPRYAGLTLTAVKVAPSPAWLQDRLRAIGLKPINNVVDVTNYVQHEIGQPLHAFDADKLAGGRIVVRMAKEGEPFTTLDGKERKLAATDLVIADAEKPACIAGVFGGLNSGVTGTTTAIFLESACFDPTTIRRTARKHTLNTDASFRFERGVDPEIAVYALKRAALLLKEVAGARVSSEVTDIVSVPAKWQRVVLRIARLNMLSGVNIAAAEIDSVLTALDCKVVSRTAEELTVDVPPYRVDVTREVDLIEEIIRIVGFDRVPLPERLMVPAVLKAPITSGGVLTMIARHLASRGYREVMSPSLINGARAVQLKASEEQALVRMKNPLSAELDVMRPTMLFGLLAAAAHNIARQQRDLRLFELGRVYGVKDGNIGEEERTALLITGDRSPDRWRAEQRKTELFDLKEEVELLCARFGLEKTTTTSIDTPLCSATIEIASGKKILARIGEVKGEVLKAFDLSQSVYFCELLDAAWSGALASRTITYAEVPKFPSVRRDLSLLLDTSVTFQQLEELARRSERKFLRSVDLFDVYEGDKLPSGKKSYALSFILQDNEKTLTDDQVDKAMTRIREALEKEVGAELRG